MAAERRNSGTLDGDRIQAVSHRGLPCRKRLESIYLFAWLNHSIVK